MNQNSLIRTSECTSPNIFLVLSNPLKAAMLFSFETVQDMSDHQAERELQEALRVQAMTPAQRWQWLQDVWGRLQDSASLLSTSNQPAPGAARSYATWEEKNQFDDDREIQQALQLSIHSGRRS